MRDDDKTVVRTRPLATRFGSYRVIEELGSGGMGTVHLAVDVPEGGVERLVALKRLHAPMSADPRFVRMFLDEMRIAARVSHPNVCRVLEVGRAEGIYYIAMDLLIGMPLAQVVEHVAASSDPEVHAAWPAMVCRIGADACEGLHAVHELADPDGRPLGVVHRDVSPENLFVGFDGVCRVIDFGIASARDRLHRTATGELRGRLAYVPPERLTDGPVDRRVDLFSLGAVLWEAIALEPLFPAHDPVAAMRAIREGLVPALVERRPDVCLDLEEVIASALAVDPARRPISARRMGEDLLAAMVEQGPIVGAPHLAAWMDRLFEGAHARQTRVASMAMRVATDPGARPSAVPPLGAPSSAAMSASAPLSLPPATLAIALGAAFAGVLAGGALAILLLT